MKSKKIMWIVLVIINFGVYAPIIFKGQDFALDRDWVINPIRDSLSVGDFFSKVFTLKFTDISPIRDISHYIDFLISNLTGFEIAIFHNWIIFIWGILIFNKILRKFFEAKIANITSSILLFHPLFLNVVYVETWRKHLLAMLFALLVISIYINKKVDTESKLKVNLFYMLSVLSVPIHVFLPLLLVVYEILFKQKKLLEALKLNKLMIVLMGVVGSLNLYYYKFIYIRIGVGEKYFEGDIGDRLLSVGRSIVQIVYPLEYTIFYARGSVENIIGIGVLVIIMYISWKLLKKEFFYLGWAFIFSPLIVINLQTTQIFLFDAYLIFSVLIFFMMVGSYFVSKTRIYQTISVCVVLFYIALSINESILRTDLVSFYKMSYKREAACPIAHNYMHILLIRKELDEFVEVGRKTIENDCFWINKFNKENIRMNINYYFYLDKRVSLQEKIQWFEKSKQVNAINILMLSSLYFQLNELSMADKYLSDFIAEDKQVQMNLVKQYEDDIVSRDLITYCEKVNLRSCQEYLKKIDI